MNPFFMAMAGGQAAKGLLNLKAGGQSRRDALRSIKSQLRDLRNQHRAFEEDVPRQLVNLGENQQGMEGGLADRRVRNLKVEQGRYRDRLLSAIRQAKRAKKRQKHSNRLGALNDILGIGTSAAAGLSELGNAPEVPQSEQVASAYGGGMSAGFNPLITLQGMLQGQQFARRRQLGLLRP